MEHFGNLVFDSARSAGGRQSIVTSDGYVIPIHIRDGLYCIDMLPPSTQELNSSPHVLVTNDAPWGPSAIVDEFHSTHHDAALAHDDVISRRDNRDPRVNDVGAMMRNAYSTKLLSMYSQTL